MNNILKNISKNIKRFLNSRNLKYGSNSIILVVAVVAIAVILNMFVGMADVKFDLTPEKLYSLGDVSRNILKGLDRDVTIFGLFDEGKIGAADDYKEVIELLDKYEEYGHVNVEYIDPDKNPAFIKEMDPDKLMELSKTDFIVTCGDKKKKLERYDLFKTEFDQNTFQTYKTGSLAEQGFTGAIKYVTADMTPMIYFMAGHEENTIDDDYATITEVLRNNNYEIKELNLLSEEKVPDDCTVMVVASPKKDISAGEKDKIEDYLDNGGKAMFMFDSLANDPSMDRFEELLAKYNLGINHDKVKENDSARYVPNMQYDIIPFVQSNSINSDLGTDRFGMVMPNSRSINILKNVKEWIKVTSLIKTSEKAVGEQIGGGDDVKGPLDIAAAVEYSGGMKPVRLIVMGNSTYVSEDVMGGYNRNGLYFFINSLFWLENKQDEEVVAPKIYETPKLDINQMQANIMGGVVVIVLPLIILLSGLFVYLRRRHL
jgi:ABC-2 type transport system permease protein